YYVGAESTALLAEERDLHVLPVFDVAGDVEVRSAAKAPLGSDFVIGQIIRVIGWKGAAAIDATGTEATRPGRVEEQVLIGLVGKVQAVNEPVVLHPLVEICARGSRNLRTLEAEPVDIALETEEADKGVVVLVPAQAPSRSQLRSDIERELAHGRG